MAKSAMCVPRPRKRPHAVASRQLVQPLLPFKIGDNSATELTCDGQTARLPFFFHKTKNICGVVDVEVKFCLTSWKVPTMTDWHFPNSISALRTRQPFQHIALVQERY